MESRIPAAFEAEHEELSASSEPAARLPPRLEARALRRLHVGPTDLTIERGTCVSIAGQSGSGKSVLLRMIADLDPHDGDAFLDGRACSRMPAPAWRHRVTYVAAESGWWDESVGVHFAAGTDFATLLPSVGLPAEASGWPVARLSTGERQRLALLRALGPDNRVLLLDEPTSGLDEASVALVEAVLRERLARGTAILLVTHDPDQAARMASRHLELRDGRLGERTT
ncbi:ABC transporter ATP-binding protein [Microvirga massiliensis]|uniref:ABC transporter ATP-binding protein n=1 Tax=Microvirga massiliensis TaxID=1033741 RepID=UPI000A50615A|nr:ABC transporter ATP-binding protein [Microvirga massiliensis]